jgi:hypothetical protein
MPDIFNEAWHRERRTLRRRVRFHIGLRQRFKRRYGREADSDIFYNHLARADLNFKNADADLYHRWEELTVRLDPHRYYDAAAIAAGHDWGIERPEP